MRYFCRFSPIFLGISFLFSTLAHAQQWSGILSPSRAINWSNAGLPATLPDGETTPNPWTPPTRTQYGSTISPSGSASTDLTNINNALSACPNGHYVLLGPGTFLIQGTVALYGQECTLRGSGANSTFLDVSGSGVLWFGSAWGTNNCLLTSGSNYNSGSTTLTCNSLTGSAPAAGDVANLSQCDTGFSGHPCSGTSADNGGLFVCNYQSTCSQQQESSSNNFQNQTFYITGVSSSGGTYAVTVSPGLYLPNWSYGQTPVLSWNNPSHDGIGVGLEDMTIASPPSYTSEFELVQMQNTYASWVKGVRFIGSGTNNPLFVQNTSHALISNSYFFPDIALDSSYPPAIQPTNTCDTLYLNNMMMSESEPIEDYGGNCGNVQAYNFARDSFTLYSFNTGYDHHGYDAFNLFEGNEFGEYTEDDTWGTHGLHTYFRNLGLCTDAPYTTFQGINSRSFQQDNYQRFNNVIGNAWGSSSCSEYQTANASGYIYQIYTGDTLSVNSLMRWGNVSTATQASDTPANSGIRFASSEVPTSLSGNAEPFENPVPSNQNLPCSFFMGTLTTCTIKTNGGTGLSWWKVCKSWSAFPTSCGTTQTQPFPPEGPDVSGGSYVNGHGYDIPAAIAWLNLPVDPTYQHSYTISSSSWSAGIETLTFSSNVLPNTTHLMGAFQLSGVASACTTGSTINAANEILITGSSSTTVQYALPSNPGASCTGTMKFPDVRQFDERVYQSDSGNGTSTPGTPTGLNGSVSTNP